MDYQHIEDTIFAKVKIDMTMPKRYGFVPKDGGFYLEKVFMDGDFRAEITIDQEGHVTGRVIDLMMEEEYAPLRASGQTGSYVSTVRYAYRELLEDIAFHCGYDLPFEEASANEIAETIFKKYGDRPDFPFEDERNKDYAVFRHPDNKKWYSLIMTIEERLLTGDEAEQKAVTVMNLKADEEKVADLLEIEGIYPAYHMNHKKWITVRLDGAVDPERIADLIEESYRLTATKGSRIPGEPKAWIVPANPKYYDIVGVFARGDDTLWKQGKGIETGDTVYMYVAVPYSAILYKCTVTKAHSAWGFGHERMDIHIDERYDKGLCPLSKMKEFGVTTVRGPRYMPKELAEYLAKAYGGEKTGR